MVGSKSHIERKEFTLSCIALARARVIGPLGGLVGLGGVTTVGWATSHKLLYLTIDSRHNMPNATIMRERLSTLIFACFTWL